MDIFKIIVIGIVGCIFILILKKQNPEFGLYISIMTGVIIFFMILGDLKTIIDSLYYIGNIIDVDSKYIKIIFKVIGIAYISEYSSELCKDCEQSSIGVKIELAGKVLILIVSLPVFMVLINLLTQLLV